jgi:hypothetical protein
MPVRRSRRTRSIATLEVPIADSEPESDAAPTRLDSPDDRETELEKISENENEGSDLSKTSEDGSQKETDDQ